ncbi:MAG TPA: hypothetical protein VGK89_03175 [Candidatus Eisenbacteria bacterium]|jgi:hypothetical protein
MTRKLLSFLLLAAPLGLGCAGPAKLAERSESKLAQGDLWRSWTLATQALDRAPGNPRAQAAAGAAAAAIAADWQRRIRGLAAVDSLAAAEQVMEFVGFRASAARYTTVQVDPAWEGDERALRQGAARTHYRSGSDDMATKRPKRAYAHLVAAERLVPGYRDAARLADRALEKAVTRVAIVPLSGASGGSLLGRRVAASWRGDLAEHLTAPASRFTRILPIEDVERVLTFSDLGRLNRDDAVRIARKAGAERVIWGTIGPPDSRSGIQFFSDRVAHRIVEKSADGTTTVRWVDVPIDVVARTRTVTVDVEYEVIATRDGATLARQRDTRTLKARVVWTAFTPEGAPDTYSLVSEQARSADPERAKQVEAKWVAVVGEGTTLAQVLDARRSRPPEPGQALARFMAGAAFVLLEELPSTEEMTFGALAGAWKPLREDLVRLDAVDDVELGVTSVTGER